MIRGNHDALSKITKELVFPENVHLFGGRAEAIEIARDRGERPIVMHGLSFAKPQATESLLAKYRPPVEGAVNIGLMHTSLGGSPHHDVYAPCSTTDLLDSGFRYWALGHIHKRSATEGPCAIVMPGIPQGRDIGESGPKSVTLASVLDDGSIVLDERIVSLAQFERVSASMLPERLRGPIWSQGSRRRFARPPPDPLPTISSLGSQFRGRRRWLGTYGATPIFCGPKPKPGQSR